MFVHRTQPEAIDALGVGTRRNKQEGSVHEQRYKVVVSRRGRFMVALAVIALAPAHKQSKRLKVYVSTGFDGNTWMNASTNLLRAIAQTKAYKDRVTLEDPIRPR